MTDQQKKYEEAAKEYADAVTTPSYESMVSRAFLAGAQFAHTAREKEIQESYKKGWKDGYDEGQPEGYRQGYKHGL